MKPISLIILGLAVVCVVARTPVARGAEEAEVRQSLAELRHADADVRRRAKFQLLRPEYFARVPAHGPEILQTIVEVRTEEDAVLLGAVDLPPDRKQAVLGSPFTPDKVRARLGDAQARVRVLARFESADSLVTVRKAALDLLYINDAESLKPFARRLESRQLLQSVHGNTTSVAVVLIQAYGETHPQEKAFLPSAYLQHADVTPAQFRAAPHQSYLRQIEKHFKDRYQLEVHLDPPLLLDTSKVGVHRAKPN